MTDWFVKRLESQKGGNAYHVVKPIQIQESSEEKEEKEGEKRIISSDEPISPSELKIYLEKMENEKAKNLEIVPNSITFDSINSFCDWYEPKKDAFLEKQRPAFDSLVQTKGMINMGCSCKIHVRQKMANDYYQNFFTKNKQTDLIPKIKEVAKVDTIIFKNGETEFLKI